MKKALLIIGVILIGLCSCHSSKKNQVLLTRTFPTSSWERFDFVKDDIEIKKPAVFNLVLDVTFDPSYSFTHFSVVFTIFDSYGTPFRAKEYRFNLKEADGSWKSTLVDGKYHFSFPINSNLSINEPGTYAFQLEYRMPVTPLTGVDKVTIFNQ